MSKATKEALNMNIQEEKISDSEISILADLERSDIESSLVSEARSISENIEIKGFRKGRASYDVVCSHLGGEASIYERAFNKISLGVISRFVKERKIELASAPEISMQKMVPGAGISFKAKIFLMPHVKLGDISKINVKKIEPKVQEKDVEEIINSLLCMRAKEASVSRGAKESDRVVLDFEVKISGAVIDNGKATDYSIILGEKKFIPGFEDHIIGLAHGDKKTFELKFPQEYYEKSFAGKEAEFNVFVKQVFERTLPVFDDEFSKKMGAYSGADDLKSKIRESVKYEKEMQEKERFEMAAMLELVKLSEIGQIPSSLIKKESEKMVRELEESVLSQGVPFSDYLKSIKKTAEDLILEFFPKAKERVELALVASEFGKSENIKVSSDDVKREIKIQKKSFHSNPEALARIESQEYKSYVANALMSKTIFENLAEKVSKN